MLSLLHSLAIVVVPKDAKFRPAAVLRKGGAFLMSESVVSWLDTFLEARAQISLVLQ